jgi:hypothetical protein
MTGKRVPRKSRPVGYGQLLGTACRFPQYRRSRSVACAVAKSLPSPKPFLAELDPPWLQSAAGGGGGLGGRGGGGFGRDGSESATVTMRFSCFLAPPVVISIRGEGRAADLRSRYSSGSVVNVNG